MSAIQGGKSFGSALLQATPCRREAVVVCLMVAIGGLLPGRDVVSADIPAVTRSRGDVVCGPRCLQYLLRHYGIETELMDLVKETQSDFEEGATLDALNEALRRRGVHTAALRLPSTAVIRWPHPVLMHLKSDDEGMGHYVIWLPTSERTQVHVWNGLAGIQTGSESRLAAKRSGVVLLTSQTEIEQPTMASVSTIRWDSWLSWLSWSGVLIVVSVIGLICRRTCCRAGIVQKLERCAT